MQFIYAFSAAVIGIVISNLATTVYLHRCLTHRSLTIKEPLRSILKFHLWLMTGIKGRDWAAVHRKHHQFADEARDPHSPIERGWFKTLIFNFFLCARELRNPETIPKYTADIQDDFGDRWVFNHSYVGFLSGWALFILGFGWLAGSLAFLFHGAGYLALNGAINSLCHVYGYRNYNGHYATNIPVLAFLTWGEGYHNNHHEHPTSPSFEAKGTEFDPGWKSVRAFLWMGQVQLIGAPIQARRTKLAAS
ncbi:MAG TPA: fatty acid desaturase [Candidatus Udaeobacter sp.]|nr:fatty acid desaturase [Candidatus Udaeobacter sp.]